MADAFISYAREDQDFARKLHAALVDAGHSLWVDWESIHPSSDWFKEIAEGIDQSDAVIFIVSRNSVHSKECRAEVEHARRAEIRIIPVLRERVEPGLLPAGAGAFQWMEFLDDASFDDSVLALRRALETDLDWVKDHTRLRLRALEWDREGRPNGKLLNRPELREADEWVRRSGEDENRRPAPLVYDYLAASARNRRRRQRWVTGAVSVALVVAAGLAVWALVERGTAQEQERLAVSRELSASSLLTLDDDPELSALLAVEAANTAPTVQAEDALRSALAQSRARLVLRGHKKDVVEARYSPDGRLIATASDDNTARLWDAETGEKRAVLRGHQLPLEGAEFSPDGSRVLTYARDYTTRVYDSRAGRRVAVLRDPDDDRVQAASFDPDGRRVVTSTYLNTALLWDSEQGEILHSLPEGEPRFGRLSADYAEISPDGRLVVTAHQGGTVRLWDASTGEALLRRRADQSFLDAHFSRSGHRLLTTSFRGGVMTWSLPELLPELVLSPEGGVEDERKPASFSPAGTLVAVAEPGGTVRVWNEAGEQVAALAGHDGQVNEANFDPSGRYVVTAGADGSALVWEVATERVVTRLDGHTAGVTSAEFSPDGDTVLTASVDDTARIWDSGTSEAAPLLKPPGASGCGNATFSPDGKRIAATDCGGPSYIFDASGEAPRELPGSSGAFEAEFSPDGRHVAISGSGSNPRIYAAATRRTVVSGKGSGTPAAYSSDGSLALLEGPGGTRVWDLRRGEQLTDLGSKASAAGAAFSPDGGLLYTAAAIDDHVYVWKLPSGRRVRRFRAPKLPRPSLFAEAVDWNADMQLSRDGRRILVVHFTGSVRIIDTASGRTLVRIPGSEAPDERMFNGAAAMFSPSEESVVTKAGWDNAVRIWDASTGRLEMELDGHTDGVASVEYDREGRLLLTRDINDTVRIWSAASGDVLLTLQDAREADMSPDGRRILVSDDLTRIHRCEVCGELDELLALAERRVTREFTQAERERYLHE